MENVEHLRLRFSGQVDEQVPATDQVAAGEGRVSQEIVGGEEDLLPNLLPHPIAAVIAQEKFPKAFGRDIRLDHRWVKAIARIGDRLLVDVGGEHLDVRRSVEVSRVFAKQHRHRVRFLARRAAGHPDPHLILAFLAGE